MDKELLKLGLEGAKLAYKNKKNCIDLGTTEFLLDFVAYKNLRIQRLSIRGTDETKDWIRNLDLRSKYGVKRSAYKAVREIKNRFTPAPGMKLLVTGHSKGGLEALVYKKVFNADWCVAFNPARGFRYWSKRKMKNTAIFTDLDDWVHWLGSLGFGYPLCERFKAKNDVFGLSIDEHDLNKWDKYIERL